MSLVNPGIAQGSKAVTGFGTPLPARRVSRRNARPVICRAGQENNSLQEIGKAASAFAAATCLTLGPVSGAALAGEFDILTEPKPTANYVIDDAAVLNRSTRTTLNKDLSDLEAKTGYRVEVATVRKLEFENDAFAFGDKVIEKWYPTVEEGDKKGILLVVTAGKDGALTGGPSFMKAVGDDLIDSIISDNIPIFTEEERFNESVNSSVKRIEAVLSGQEDPGPPARKDTSRKRTYKTKSETARFKGATSTIVISLLVISVVVPMLQYYGYTAKE